MASNLLEWEMRHHEALKEWLSGKSASVLVDLLMESARNDDAVRVVLCCLAEHQPTRLASQPLLHQAIRLLTTVPSLTVKCTHQSDLIQHRLNWMLFLLAAILDQGHAAPVIEAAEFALERSEILAMEDLDSEYWADSVRAELWRLHRLACERERPDAVALAVRWAKMRQTSKLGWFDDFGQAYADILGADGLAAHQRSMGSAH